jgi:hypothetical protein
MGAPPGAMEAHSGTIGTSYRVLESKHGAMEAQRAFEVPPGALEDNPGDLEANPGDREAQPGTCGQLQPRLHLTCSLHGYRGSRNGSWVSVLGSRVSLHGSLE